MNKIAIIGSGPSGLFLAKNLLKKLNNNISIDIYEKLNAPLGLIKYGVAPDHPEVKNKFIKHFEQIFKCPNVNIHTNSNFGRDFSISKLSMQYDAVALCTGMSDSKRKWQGIKNCFGSDEIFGWYNQNPEYINFNHNLSQSKRLVIVGNGNVALDMARMFAKNHSPATNMDSKVFDVLKASQINEIIIIGRRDIFNTSFSPSELREFTELKGYCKISVNPEIFESKNSCSKIQIKNANILKDLSQNDSDKVYKKEIIFRFEAPVSDVATNDNGSYVLIDKTQEHIYFDILIECIGFKQAQIFIDLPQDQTGKILTQNAFNVKNNIYACGWSRTGPRGTITDSMIESSECANQICSEIYNKYS